MKTAIKFLLIFFTYSITYSQSKDTLYIKYDKNMIINDYQSKISLSFSIKSSDKKINTYNFKIDNLDKDFKTPLFKELRDTIIIKKNNEIKTLTDFSKLKPCDLHYLFSDLKKIILIKKENKIQLKYRLNYWSTQRGWFYINQ